MEHLLFKDLRMEGGYIFPYQSVYWIKIWILNLVDPLLLLGYSSLTPLNFLISSPIIDFLTTPKILQFSIFFSYFPFLPYFSMWSSNTICQNPLSLPYHWDLTDVPNHHSFLCTESLWKITSSTSKFVLYNFNQIFVIEYLS